MTTPKRRKREPWESVRYTHPAFKPYTTALGELALAWNGLHSEMALLFCALMGGGYVNQFLAVWHAIKNDRAQRDVLLAATKEHREHREYGTDFGNILLDAIKWLCGQADRIEEFRNNALHSPLWGYASDGHVVPLTGLGHERAKKLMEADAKRGLLAEIRYYRDFSLILTDYVKQIDGCLTGRTRSPWPQKPSLPDRGQTQKNRRPQSKTEKAQSTPA